MARVRARALRGIMDARTTAVYRAGDEFEVSEERFAEMVENSVRTGGSPAVELAGGGDAEETPSSDGAKPTVDSTKADIRAYLDSLGIAYGAKDTKAELLALVP